MDVFNIFNKASQKLNDYFSFIENKINTKKTEIQDSLIRINSKIFIWIKDTSFKDDDFIRVIRSNFRDNYMIYNLLNEKIETDISPDKIIDFNPPKNPSFSLEFLISFCISSKNWLNAVDDNILVIHDDLTKNDGNIFYLISTIIIYNNKAKNKNEIKDPVDIYQKLLSEFENHKFFQQLLLHNNQMNNIRYLNYFFSIQKSPLITLKKIFLKGITIMGAPAIDNDENKDSTHYITINKDSYYIPVVRIKSNNKFIYSSYNPRNEQNNKLEKILYSTDNGVNFDINQICFNDVCVEVMHKGEKSFRLLFTIQFNTFFIDSNYSIKFSKEQIDSINQDIRYPNNFCVELFFDGGKDEKLSPFDEYSITWKTLLSEFIVKGLSNNTKNNSSNNTSDKNNKNNNSNQNKNFIKDNENDIKDIKEREILDSKNPKNNNGEGGANDINININIDKKENFVETNDKINESDKNQKEENKDIKEDKDEDILNTIGNTNNTLNQVNDLLKKIEGGNNNDKEEDNEDDDEDIENYLKNLENK